MTYTKTKNKIDALIHQAEANGVLSQEQLRQLHYKFRLEWNYNSNSMEGNTLTVAETRSVMIGNIDVRRKPLKDILEVKGHDEVISEILRIGKAELRLSEKRIKEIHKGIMQEEDPVLREQIGQWKVKANMIYNVKGERYDFVKPEEVAEQIHDLLNRTNAAMDQIVRGQKDAPHPIDVALNFHIDYLNIHPFYDGNGRTARILSNLILVALGYPPFWITEQERDVYYRYIGDIQCYGGRREDLFAFISELILRSQQMIIDVQAGKSIEEADDIDKEIELLKRELKAREELEERTRLDKKIKENYKEVIEPLFRIVENGIKKYADLFHLIVPAYFYEFNSDNAYDTVLIGTNLTAVVEEIEWYRDISCIKLCIGLESLKLVKYNESIDIELACRYSSKGYEISIDDDIKISRSYVEEVTVEEQVEISGEINRIILEKIKELQRKENGNE